jgi:hypothetical protein
MRRFINKDTQANGEMLRLLEFHMRRVWIAPQVSLSNDPDAAIAHFRQVRNKAFEDINRHFAAPKAVLSSPPRTFIDLPAKCRRLWNWQTQRVRLFRQDAQKGCPDSSSLHPSSSIPIACCDPHFAAKNPTHSMGHSMEKRFPHEEQLSVLDFTNRRIMRFAQLIGRNSSETVAYETSVDGKDWREDNDRPDDRHLRRVAFHPACGHRPG